MTNKGNHSATSETLNELWADGLDFSEYFAGRLDEVPLGKSFLERQNIELPKDYRPTALQAFAVSMDKSARQKARSDAVVELVRRDLVASRIICLGRREVGGMYLIERVEAAFWLGADLHPTSNCASLGDVVFDKLRLARIALPSIQQQQPEAESSESQNTDQTECNARTQGRPSHGEKIQAAIEHFARSSSSWFEENSEQERRNSYYSFVREHYRINPTKVSGFGAKTIQKYETQYRRSGGR